MSVVREDDEDRTCEFPDYDDPDPEDDVRYCRNCFRADYSIVHRAANQRRSRAHE